MADYKELLGALVNKAKDAVESSGIGGVYQQGADRAKAYSRIARLTLSMNSQVDELKKVYTEIGKLYFQQARENPEGVFAPLFAQVGTLMADLEAKEKEVRELKEQLNAEKDIEVEISVQIDDFDAVVDATENEGKGGDQ
mgnify:CR=1 FL=1